MKKSVKNLQDGFIRYHSCGIYRRDRTNVLVTKRRPCYKPTNACFWMLDEDVKKKVQTRNRESNERIYHSQSLKKQYQSELIKRKQYEYYSTESDDSSSDNNSNYDSDDNKLVIDIETVTKPISNTLIEIENVKKSISNTIMPYLINETVNQTKQLPEIKNTDQDLSFQIPDNK